MPSGAKKRKALKKKKQQGAIGTSTDNKGFNGDNLHGNDGSQDGRGSDGSLSSPGSQGNEEFGRKDPSPAPSSGLVKGAAKEISGDAGVTQGLGPKSGNAIAVERVMDDNKNIVGKSTNSSSENRTHPAKNVACQDACGDSITEITPVVDSVKPVSKVVISEKSDHVETSTHSNLVKQKSDGKEVYPSPGLEQNNNKVVTLPRSVAETSKNVENVRKSEIPVSSEEERLLLPGPPVVRKTSWLSCCGLFDAMTGSDR